MNYLEVQFSSDAEVQRFIRTSHNAHPRASFGSPDRQALRRSFLFSHDRRLSNGVCTFSTFQAFRNIYIGYIIANLFPPNSPEFAPASPAVLVQSDLSLAASVFSRRFSSTSMPPTPALTDQNFTPSHIGAIIPNIQLRNLPELQMLWGFYQQGLEFLDEH
jgi:hypothetical protein